MTTPKVLLSISVVLGLLLLIEGGLRTFGFVPHPKRRHLIYRYPDELEPMRELPPLPSEGASPSCILCLGDSFTYGMGVTTKETYPGRLKTLLGPSVEVINAGTLGSGPFSQRKSLLDLLPCRPKLVILGALINDAVDAERELAERKVSKRRKGGHPGSRTLSSRCSGWLRDHTATQPFLFTLRQRAMGVPYPFDRRDVTWERLRKQKFDHYNSTLRRGTWEAHVFPVWLELNAACKQRGIDFWIVVFPVDVQLWDSNVETRGNFGIQQRIREFADAAQIPTFDLTPGFRDALQSGRLRLMYGEGETRRLQSLLFTKSAPALFLNDGHPSPFAYEIVADELHAAIVEKAVFP